MWRANCVTVKTEESEDEKKKVEFVYVLGRESLFCVCEQGLVKRGIQFDIRNFV